METTVYNQAGKETGKFTLPESVFGLPWNSDLVHQVSVSMESNKRTPVAHVKDRGAVRGGGKKPWRQKGTGRARHGSSRSPIWVGGGITHGPTNEKNYARKVNKDMKSKALAVVLSKKFKQGEIIFVDSISFTDFKTKEARKVLEALGKIKGFERLTTKSKNAIHIALPKKDVKIERSFRNFSKLSIGELRNINVLDTLGKKYILIVDPKESVKILESKI